MIEYFDTLVDGHVGLEAFLRGGAALLSAVPAGLRVPERRLVLRVDTAGRPTPVPEPGPWPCRPLGRYVGAIVWIERDGEPHANDHVVLERLAMGVGVTFDRAALADDQAGLHIEQLVDGSVPLPARLRAAGRLHLDAGRPVQVLAVPPDDATAARSRRATVLSTVAGPVFVMLRSADSSAAETPARAGIGRAAVPSDLPSAWQEALAALRLTSVRRPVLDVAEIGALTVLAAGVDATPSTTPPPPDVVALELLVTKDAAVLETLDVLTGTESVRAAAGALGVHHSTVQQRIAAFRQAFGFEPTSPAGRLRLATALAVHRLMRTRFDDAES